MDWKTINSRYVRPAEQAWKSGRHDDAERAFREGLEATNHDGFVALRLAEFLEDQERLEEAHAFFEIALRKLPMPNYKHRAKEGLDRTASRAGAPGPRQVAPPAPTPAPRQEPSRFVGLLSCTKNKLDYVCTARELYSASDSFREHLAFAERHYARTYVASAKHGLVELTQLLAPYDFNLDDYSIDERDVWARFVAARLRLEGLTNVRAVFIHASEKYGAPLQDALRTYEMESHIIPFDRAPTLEHLRESDSHG